MAQEQRQADWNRGPSPFKGAVLGLVLEKPGHGYELANRLNHRLGPGWAITAADIYPVLTRLEKAELIRSVYGLRAPGQRQTKVVYHPTAAAAGEFDRWMQAPSAQPPLRNELMAKISVARSEDLPRVLVLLDDAERELLELLERSEDELPLPSGSWQGLVVDIERYHTLAHWKAELHAIVRARERIRTYQQLAVR